MKFADVFVPSNIFQINSDPPIYGVQQYMRRKQYNVVTSRESCPDQQGIKIKSFWCCIPILTNHTGRVQTVINECFRTTYRCEISSGKLDPINKIQKLLTNILSNNNNNNSNSSNCVITNNTKFVSLFVTALPPSLLLDQKLVKKMPWSINRERTKKSHSEQEQYGICCTVHKNSGLTLYGANICVDLDSPSSVPVRKLFQLIPFLLNDNHDDDGEKSGSGGSKEGQGPTK